MKPYWLKDDAGLGAGQWTRAHRLETEHEGRTKLLALCEDAETARAIHSGLVDRQWAIMLLQRVLQYGRGEVPGDVMDDIRRAVQSMEERA